MAPVCKLQYSQKIWPGIKFGGLAVCLSNRQIKNHQNFLFTSRCMVIPYQTTKFRSAIMFVMAIWDPTAKSNSCQYFQLYYTCIMNITHSSRGSDT